MPLIQTQNLNTANLQNIISWLEQIKMSGQQNARLPLGPIPQLDGSVFDLEDLTLLQLNEVTVQELETLPFSVLDCTISFYTDAAKTNLAFTDSTAADEAAFTTVGVNRFYTPPDSLINNATSLSTTLCQPEYFVTATFEDGSVFNTTYNNSKNLMFQSVIVASKPNPQFATATNQAIIVPMGEKNERIKSSGDYDYQLCTFDVYAQLNISNWGGLSEVERITQQQQVVNAIRNTLYIDRYRDSNATFYNKDICGTWVGEMKPIKSDALLKCMVQVKTASLVGSTDF